MKLLRFYASVVLTVAFSAVAFAQLNVVQRSHLPYSGGRTSANICGYVDSLGNEYALVGVQDGMSIVDVTNPAAPVEVRQIPNVDNLWKEIKVYGKYAYVTTEGGGGLQIVNMSSLPNAAGITYHNWTGDGAIAGTLNTIHALHIDGHYVYIYGSNLFSGAAVVADLADPWNPHYVGNSFGAVNKYVHDGYVRNDTMYGGHIYDGYFSVIDFTNKAAPVALATQYTPNNFTHNTWLSTNSHILFTTDEVDNSFLASYDITDLNNITLLDKIQSNPGSQSIVHNTHILRVAGNDYAVTSWYKDGFTIVDAGRPNNLVEVAQYDNYAGSGGGFEGAWGVYPFLPSGNIVVSNIEDGLYVYTPTYVRACYLEGTITDSVCGVALGNVHITVTAAGINDSTDLSGVYRTGTPTPGTYTVTYSRSGYVTKTITGVVLAPGIVNNIDIQLVPFNTVNLNGSTTDQATSNPVSNVLVNISDADNSYSFVSDAGGSFSSCNVVSANDYDVTAGKWGYNTICLSGQDISTSGSAPVYALEKGYYDDFTFNFGWTVSGSASTGAWVRGVPVGTTNGIVPANPGADVTTDCGDMAYVTGNGGGSASADDVDNGSSILVSPVFDLATYTDPFVDFSRWFYNSGGTGTPNDSLTISISNGISTAVLDVAIGSTPTNSTWVAKTFQVSSYVTPTATMRLIVRTADVNPGHLVEAGFDKFLVREGATGINENAKDNVSISAYPNPFTTETTIAYQFNSKQVENAKIMITDVTGRVVEVLAVNQPKGTVTLNKSINAGVYFVSMLNGNEVSAPVKIVKMK